MPTYVYHCDECNDEFEAHQKFSDDPLTQCPEGHEGVRRVYKPANIIFKGSGWYIKDSKASANGTSSSSKAKREGDKSESAASSEGTKGDGGEKSEKSEKSAAA